MPEKKKETKKTKETEETKATEPKVEKEPELTEEEALAQFQETIDKMPVQDLVVNMMMNLASTAYKKMGLPAESNAKNKDLKQAKQAIDCVDALLNAIAGDLEARDTESFRQTIANLKMTFAQLN